jgi:hypothetical protein
VVAVAVVVAVVDIALLHSQRVQLPLSLQGVTAVAVALVLTVVLVVLGEQQGRARIHRVHFPVWLEIPARQQPAVRAALGLLPHLVPVVRAVGVVLLG